MDVGAGDGEGADRRVGDVKGLGEVKVGGEGIGGHFRLVDVGVFVEYR